MPRALDLGSGPCPAPGFTGVDLCAGEVSGSVVVWDLTDGSPWPFDDESVEALHCSHFIEHIPRDRVVIGTTEFQRTIRSPGEPKRVEKGRIARTQDAFFWFFDEAYRVAKSGCRFTLRWPHPQSDAADQDPTHARRIPASMLNYLSVDGRRALGVQQYPVFCDWRLEPGSVHELASTEALAPFLLGDGSYDIAAAKRAHGVFHEIVATLVKP
jgi:hypothetical protein